MAENPRVRRMADRIKVIVSESLDRQVKDPRLGFVTVTEVRLTGDLQQATVFYTILGTAAEREDTAKALASATGFLRSEVGKNITARVTPSLEFVLDAMPENAETIQRLLLEAKARDEEIKKQAATASYAGDADPYQKPRERILAEEYQQDEALD